MKRNLLLAAMPLIWMALLPVWCPAQITGVNNPNPVLISASTPGLVSLQLGPGSESIDGLSGEIHYDPALLTNFSISTGPGAVGFFSDGFSSVPGIFTFVLYKTIPGGALNLSNAVITVGFEKAPGGPASPSTVTYAMEAAGQITNPSLGEVISISVASPDNPSPQTVTFGSFDVQIANGAIDWALYE